MSREDIGIESYAPGGGYRPIGPSLRGFLKLLLCMAAYFAATELLRVYLDMNAVRAFGNAVMGLCIVSMGAHQILNAERLEAEAETEGVRGIRVAGIIMVVFGTVFATLAVRSILYLAEGW